MKKITPYFVDSGGALQYTTEWKYKAQAVPQLTLSKLMFFKLTENFCVTLHDLLLNIK